MALLGPILETLRPNPILVGMDSNLHHAMWNPLTYTHTHREVDGLIALMNKAGLLLLSEAGFPTFNPNQTRSGHTTVSLPWITPDWY